MHLRDLLLLARPYRAQLILLALLSMAGSAVSLVMPALGARMLGGLLEPTRQSTPLVAAILGAAIALSAVFSFAAALFSGRTAAMLLADLRQHIYRHIQSLPMDWHDNQRHGDTLSLMTYEIGNLGQFLAATLTSVPSRLLTAAGAVIIMFTIDPLLASLVPLAVPAFYVILRLVGRRMRRLAQAIQEAEAEVVAVADENLEMLPAIKAFAREQIEARRYGEAVERAMDLTLRENRIQAALEPAIRVAAAGAAVALLILAGDKVRSGTMSSTDLFGFLLYAALLTRPVGALAQVYGQFQTAKGTLGRMRAVLRREAEPGYEAGETMVRARGEIALENVGFAYSGREAVLDSVDLVIPAGQIMALVGENGAGKTTLVNLLLRFYEPSAGRILFDGRDIRDFRLQDLRRQFGLVPQRPLLFNGTIRDNIAFGLEGAGDDEIETAAVLAQAHDFIGEQPRGYATRIGDHGVKLSGGQRQRIALARALLGNPPVLVFDEATAMFDLDGESAFVAACGTALRGRTVILITHRPASLALADRLVRVESGTVREVGSYLP